MKKFKPNKIFYPIAILYGLIIKIRNYLFDKNIFKENQFDLKVISVGNITVGGTGKSPMIEFLAKLLKSKNKKFAIISRGYKRESFGQVIVSNGEKILVEENISGDEPMQIAKKFPCAIVIVDKNRSRAIETAKYQYNCDIVLLDDAFQHRKVKRDCNIVLIDGTKLSSSLNLIPVGEGREPLSSFKRSNAIIITKCESLKSKTMAIDLIRNYSKAPIFTTTENIVSFKSVTSNKTVNLSQTKSKTAVVFCGIAKPEYFKEHLEQNGIAVLKFICFPDHHRFSLDDLNKIILSVKECNPKLLITTEKDFVRLNEEFLLKLKKERNFLYSNYEVKIKEEKSFLKFMDKYV